MYNDKDPLINTYKSRFRKANGTNSWHIGLTVFTTLVAIIAIPSLILGIVNIANNENNELESVSGFYIGEITFVNGLVEDFSIALHADGTLAFISRLEEPMFYPEFLNGNDHQSSGVGVWKHISGDTYRWGGAEYRQGTLSPYVGYLTDALSMTLGSPIVTVTHVNHGYNNGVAVKLSALTAPVQGIPTTEINAIHVISVVDLNHYTITVTTNAIGTSGAPEGGALESELVPPDGNTARDYVLLAGNEFTIINGVLNSQDPRFGTARHPYTFGDPVISPFPLRNMTAVKLEVDQIFNEIPPAP